MAGQIFATARILLVNAANEVLVVRRSATDARHAGEWEAPGGRLEPGEDVMAAAIRETEEEIGITAKDLQLVFAISGTRYEGTGTWVFFLERIAGENPPVHLSREHDESRWVPFGELPKYFHSPKLLDMHAFLTEHHIV